MISIEPALCGSILLVTAISKAFAAALVACIAVECGELVDLLRHLRADPRIRAAPGFEPFVSIHVPIHAEPPVVVENTLRALAALDYERFEVLVVCNNTPDPAYWLPVKRICRALGDRFRFFNVPRLAGYKAGALNFALRNTSPEAAVISSLDSDYVVDPNFLRDLAPAFADPCVSFVQCPQDYREWEGSQFLRMCYWEYWQFFAVGMVLQARRNAAMLHGTMSLIRKSALIEAGGWAEWCLTEDSECGIRLIARGGTGLYTKQSYGRGLTPFCFADYKRQRRRWVIGGAQQLRRHFWLLLRPGRLTLAQRLHYLRGWVPWLRDGMVVACLPFLMVAAVCALGEPAAAFTLAPITVALAVVLGHHLVRQWLICRVLLRLSWRDTAGAACAVVGLTWVVGCAWLKGMLGSPGRYFRTPKEAGTGHTSFGGARAETAIGLVMAALAGVLLGRLGENGLASSLAPLECAALLLASTLMGRCSEPQGVTCSCGRPSLTVEGPALHCSGQSTRFEQAG